MENKSSQRQSLLLHICCAACGAYVGQLLKGEFRLTLFYYNPNIYPLAEFEKRQKEVEMIAKKYDCELIVVPYQHEAWLEKIKGNESEPEKGRRCYLCYEDRIQTVAKYAKEYSFDAFASTLSVSPHKVYRYISEIGQKIDKEKRIKFIDRDFKKKDGSKKASVLSRELGLYRQNYCGCEFSRRES